jgi:hypothetical protein
MVTWHPLQLFQLLFLTFGKCIAHVVVGLIPMIKTGQLLTLFSFKNSVIHATSIAVIQLGLTFSWIIAAIIVWVVINLYAMAAVHRNPTIVHHAT